MSPGNDQMTARVLRYIRNLFILVFTKNRAVAERCRSLVCVIRRLQTQILHQHFPLTSGMLYYISVIMAFAHKLTKPSALQVGLIKQQLSNTPHNHSGLNIEDLKFT